MYPTETPAKRKNETALCETTEAKKALDAMRLAGIVFTPPSGASGASAMGEGSAAAVLQKKYRVHAATSGAEDDAALRSLVGAMATDEGRVELKALFKKLDANDDGEVTSKEWGAAVGKPHTLRLVPHACASQTSTHRPWQAGARTNICGQPEQSD